MASKISNEELLNTVKFESEELSVKVFADPNQRYASLLARAHAYRMLGMHFFAYEDLLSIPEELWTEAICTAFQVVATRLGDKIGAAKAWSLLPKKEGATMPEFIAELKEGEEIPIPVMPSVPYVFMPCVERPSLTDLSKDLKLPKTLVLGEVSPGNYCLYAAKMFTKDEVILDEEPFCLTMHPRYTNCWHCVKKFAPGSKIAQCPNCIHAVYCDHECRARDLKSHILLHCRTFKTVFAEHKAVEEPYVFDTLQFILRFCARLNTMRPHVLFHGQTTDAVVRNWIYSLISTSKGIATKPMIDTKFVAQLCEIMRQMLPGSCVDAQMIVALIRLKELWTHRIGMNDIGSVLFRAGSFFNHDCDFNVEFTGCGPSEMGISSIKNNVFVARRKIKKGEKLSITYVSPFASAATRAAVLKVHGIVCTCILCKMPVRVANEPVILREEARAKLHQEFKDLAGV